MVDRLRVGPPVSTLCNPLPPPREGQGDGMSLCDCVTLRETSSGRHSHSEPPSLASRETHRARRWEQRPADGLQDTEALRPATTRE